MNSIVPTQIDFSTPKSPLGSTLNLGKNYSNESLAGIGFGQGGVSDPLGRFTINLSEIKLVQQENSSTVTVSGQNKALFTFDVQDIITIMNTSSLSDVLDIRAREVFICEYDSETQTSEERKMVVFASQTYPTGLSLQL